MIRIVNDSTFGYWNGQRVERKTKKSAPFSISVEREKELVDMGIAAYVDVQSSSERMTLAQLQEMKLNELKEIGQKMGETHKPGTKKTEYAARVYDAMNANETVNDNDAPPVFDSADAVV